MEAKKNPDKDVNRKSFQFFCIGLIISTGLAISAFEWRTEKKIYPPREATPIANDLILDVTPTVIEEIKLPEKKLQPLATKPILVTPESITTATTETVNQDPISLEYPELTAPVAITIPIEDPEAIHVIAEQQPIPVNGFDALYKMIGQNIKYPRPASRAGIEGKVSVEFVVNKNGTPSDLKVTKGIGGGCDEEAMRVIALSKWQPGKQRGNPVRVRMSMAINFKLNH